MKRWMMKAIMITGLLAIGSAVVIAALPRGTSQGIFYRVSGGKADLFILGSIHIGSDEMYPLSREIASALRLADVFVFECDTQSHQAQVDINALMHYPQGDELANHIDGESDLLVQSLAQKLGYPMSMLSKMKPWGIVSMLATEIASAQMGEKSAKAALALGVEERIQKEVRGRPIVYLETAVEQLGRMDHFSPELLTYLLQAACRTILFPDQMSQADKDTRNWPKWWSEGNAQAFAASYQQGLNEEEQPALAQEYHTSLMTERNKAMARQLRDLLEGDQTAFATVGLMHLVLPGDSILAELEQMGYTVEQMTTQP